MPAYFLASIFFLNIFIRCFGQVDLGLAWYYPTVQGELIPHTYYVLDYNEAHEQANWVIYFAGLAGTASRKDHFREDPTVTTGSATLTDYKNSGYDRGHLAPAADMKMNALAMSESFYMSNMSPQNQTFNRGIWSQLEQLVRAWAQDTHSLADVIITGPVLGDSTCGQIGQGVTVPCWYYKIYADPESGRAIAFILPNAPSQSPLRDFATTIDSVEQLTEIDFFYQLPDSVQQMMEARLLPDKWDWGAKHTTHTPDEDETETRQCAGITASGSQCSRSATKGDFCWQHGEE